MSQETTRPPTPDKQKGAAKETDPRVTPPNDWVNGFKVYDSTARQITLSLFENCHATKAFPRTLTLAELAEKLQPKGTTKDGSAICGAVFDPPVRKKSNVQAVHALILDIDDAEGTIATLTRPLADYESILWTTWSHTDTHRPKFRLLLPMARPVNVEEYAAIWRHIDKLLGGIVDKATKDASRLQYLPRETGLSGKPASVFVQSPPARVSKGWLDPDDLPGGVSVADLVQEKQKTPRDEGNRSSTTEEIESALAAIDPARLSYDEWLSVGMALHSDNQPCTLWDTWSQSDPRYEPGVCADKWDSFEGNGTTLGTLFHLARQHGWDRPAVERKVGRKTILEFADRNESKVARAVLAHHRAPTGERVVFDRGAYWQWADHVWQQMPDVREGDTLARTLDEWQTHEQMWLKPTDSKPEGQVFLLSTAQQRGIISQTRIKATREGFFDAAPRGVAFRNAFIGAVGRTIVIQPPKSEQRQQFAYSFDYDEHAKCLETEKCVAQILVGRDDEDTEARCNLWWQFFGAALLGLGPRYMRALVLLGRKGCGKSTLGELIEAAMPSGSCGSIQPHDFSDDKKAIAFTSMRLNYIGELWHERPISNHTVVKSVIGGEMITARDVYRSKATFRPEAAHLWCANRVPSIPSVDGSFWDRFMMMECTRQFRNTPQEEKGLHVRLVRDELPGIVRRAIQGAEELLKANQYAIPATSKRALQVNWIKSADAVSLFVDEACEDVAHLSARSHWSLSTPLYRAFSQWCVEHGHHRMSQHEFTERLMSRGVERAISNGNRYSIRVRLHPEPEDEVEEDENVPF